MIILNLNLVQTTTIICLNFCVILSLSFELPRSSLLFSLLISMENLVLCLGNTLLLIRI